MIQHFLHETLPRLNRAQRLMMAGCAGALVSAGLPPLYLLPLVYIGFGLQCLLIISARQQFEHEVKAAKESNALFFKYIWWESFTFSFVYALIAFHWIALSVLVTPQMHSWMAPLLPTGLASVIALFITPALALAAMIPGHFTQYFMLVLLLSISEWLRGYIFPWNNFAQTFGLSNALLQPLSTFGRDGYGMIVLACLCLPAYALTMRRVTAGKQFSIASISLIVPLIFTLWGAIRLDQAPDPQQNFWANAGIRLVQPNIAQADKLNPALTGDNLTRLIDLSFDRLPGWVSHIIWPEVALHIDMTRYPQMLNDLSSLLPAGGVLISGTLREENNLWYNAMIALNADGVIDVVHDKTQLVPFGEYMPLPFLGVLGGVSGTGFNAGDGLNSYRAGLLPYFTSLICYEVIFSQQVVAPDGRSHWMLNITNDAWFGHSSGPYQHLGIARWRAIEEGMPLVRVANTGISAVFDAYGRILASRGLGQASTINFRLPKPLENRPALLAYRDMVSMILLLILGAAALVCWLREVKPRLRFEL